MDRALDNVQDGLLGALPCRGQTELDFDAGRTGETSVQCPADGTAGSGRQ